ncbi:MAG: LysE family translocator [Proteobacteria bacterium]|nr:LysE family translocator [Pseudomonadota bacterium]
MQANLPAFFLFALVAGFTPGPNNLMLAASGVNFGLRRTLPHLLGVVAGYPVLFAAVGTGLGGVFQRLPWLHTALMIIGSLYLAWLAWKIAFAPAMSADPGERRPLNFWQAAAFQWVNPKGWMMAITAVSVYAAPGENYLQQVAVMTLVALFVTLGSTSTWAGFGVGIRKLFENRPVLLRAFNVAMGVLLLASLLPMLLSVDSAP